MYIIAVRENLPLHNNYHDETGVQSESRLFSGCKVGRPLKHGRLKQKPFRNQHDGAAGGRDGEQACAVEGERNAQHERQRAR